MRKIAESFILIWVFPFLSQQAFAQQKIALESLIPPAPNAAEIGKYGTIPVGALTGVPDISFPLYEIQSGSLKMPITLSYHAGGNQVNQKATEVGLGWSLMAGGTISRTVYGTDDNGTYGYFNYTPPLYSTLLSNTNYFDMQKYTNGGYDLQPDLFAYNLCGKSGKFNFTKSKSFRTIPFDPIKIQKTGLPGGNFYFQITDENGTIYKFDVFTKTISDFGSVKNTISSWYLTYMISADLTDTIKLEYVDNFIEDPMEQNVFQIGGAKSSATAPISFQFGNSAGLVDKFFSTVTYNEKLLSKISFRNGYILFKRNGVRKDVSSANKSLDEIQVIDQFDNVIRKVNFSHDYFIASPFVDDWAHYRLKLTSFTEQDRNAVLYQSTSFDYDATTLPPVGSYNIDYWGYYNGATNNQDFIPVTTTTVGELNSVTFVNGDTYNNGFTNLTSTYTFGHANREPSAAYMKAGILNKITYPTGGYTLFEYEPHVYQSTFGGVTTDKLGGGLRVKKIKNYTDNNTLSKEVNYVYGEGENGYGLRIFDENFFYKNYEDVASAYFKSGIPACSYGGACWIRKFMGVSKYNCMNYLGSPILYSVVAKYDGSPSSNMGKTIYKYSINQDPLNLPNDFVNSENYGSLNNGWDQGQLIEETNYKVQSGAYYPLQTKNLEYSSFQLTTDTAILCKQFKIYNGDCYFGTTGPEPGNTKYGQGYFSLYPYPIKSGIKKLVKETIIDFDQSNQARTLNSITSNKYANSVNMLPTERSVLRSDGSLKIQRFTYPNEMVGLVYSAMTAKNMISPIIEQRLFESDNNVELLLSTTQISYKQLGDLIIRDTVKTAIGANPFEARIVYRTYDNNGNLLEQQKIGDAINSIIWDYGNTYPVASVNNAIQSDIAYTSFESNGKGNWNYSGLKVANPLPITGFYAYNLTNTFPVTKSSLTSSKVYRLSYWTRNTAAFTITGTQSGYPITGPSRNGWNYFEHKITGVTSVSISGTGILDELRLMPFDAQMETYTYTPLVGMTSSCDANNKVTYYEYDALQRLLLVRDQDRNIVKKYSYNYSGQAINDNIFYNGGTSVSVKRQNTTCTSCQIGSTVTYTVPANKYSASSAVLAAQLQQADIDANAQNYANSFGSCSVASLVPIFATNGISAYSFSLQFHNNCTGVNYNFTLNASASNISLSGVPEGNYTVTLSANGAGTTQFTYKVNGFTQHTAVGSITLDLQTGSNQVLVTP